MSAGGAVLRGPSRSAPFTNRRAVLQAALASSDLLVRGCQFVESKVGVATVQ